MHAYDNMLRDDEGKTIAVFSSHWAACAAMIRRHDPNFKSLGGDRTEDLATEAAIELTNARDR